MDDQERLNHAFETYCQYPSLLNGIELSRLTGKSLRGPKIELARVGPALAIFEVILDRGHVTFRGPRMWFYKNSVKLLHWHLLRKYRSRPMWNDYFMCRFLLTQEREAAVEIHCRARHIKRAEIPDQADTPWQVTGFTAEWMAGSQRSQNQNFDEALKEIESTCAHCLGPGEGRTEYVGSFCRV